MKPLMHILSLFAFVLLMACASTKEPVTKNRFTFVYDGVQYEILSVNTQSGEGTNYLVIFNENGTTAVTARDLNQDGELDILLDQRSSLTSENLIYQAGISAAMRHGNLQRRESLRTYETTKNDTLLNIKTYLEPDGISNLFSIMAPREQTDQIFRDMEADGTLDEREKGSLDLIKAGTLYQYALQRGINDQRIFVQGDVFIVKEYQKVKTSHYDTESD